MTSISGKDELHELERALARLSAIERDIFLLSAREGLRNEEIAARIGIGISETERHLASAVYSIGRELDRPARRSWRFW